MESKDFLEEFQDKAIERLLKQCKEMDLSSGCLMETDDINHLWYNCASDYIADAIKEFNSYPEVALAWASYLGIAAAYLWDGDWEKNKNISNLYRLISNKRGFDEMDEFVIEDIMGLTLKSPEHLRIENSLRKLSDTILNLISKEGVESMTSNAFHIFAISSNAMFKIGASIGLYILGYKYEIHSNCVN